MDQINVNMLTLEGNIRAEEALSSMDERELEEFRSSAFYRTIAQNGIKSPILVFEDEGKLVVWDGSRRVLAAKLAGRSQAPYVMIPAPHNDAEMYGMQVIFNDLREELTYVQRARIYQRMKEEGLSQAAIARAVGVSEAEVSLALSTLNAHPKIQQALNEGRISQSAVEPLLTKPLEVQEELVDAALQAKTVRKVRALVQARDAEEALGGTVEVHENTLDLDDLDPMELIFLEDLDKARTRLQAAAQADVVSPKTRAQARRTIQQIVEIAMRLGEELS